MLGDTKGKQLEQVGPTLCLGSMISIITDGQVLQTYTHSLPY